MRLGKKEYMAWIGFGLGSWITTNGIFQELPHIAKTAPEGYDLFSYATVLVALSNVFPAAYYYLLNVHCVKDLGQGGRMTGAGGKERLERYGVYGFVGCCGVLICVLLGLFWHKQSGGRSIFLLVLIFFGGGIDSTTSVIFYPFAHRRARGDVTCVTAMMTGEALTGLFVAGLAAAQESDDDDGDLRFSVETFFYLLSAFVVLSVACYAWLAVFTRSRRPLRSTRRSSCTSSSNCRRRNYNRIGKEEDDGVVVTQGSCDFAVCAADDGFEGSPIGGEEKEDVVAMGGDEHAKARGKSEDEKRCQLIDANDDEEGGKQEMSRVAREAKGDTPLLDEDKPPPKQLRWWGDILFWGQAALSFVENGLHTSLLPHSLAPFPSSDVDVVSLATKLGFAGASICTVLAQCNASGKRDDISTYGFALCNLVIAATSLWMICAAANVSALTSASFSPGWAVTIVVACKCAIAFSKTALFLHFFRDSSSVAPSDDNTTSAEVFRHGGAGIQLGALVGALVFFVLTVPCDLLSKSGGG
eukprot:g3918.t1